MVVGGLLRDYEPSCGPSFQALMSTRHHLPHVGGGWLGRVDAPGLLTLGHAPPELVVLVQDGGLGLLAQLPQGGAGRAGGRGALDNLDIYIV